MSASPKVIQKIPLLGLSFILSLQKSEEECAVSRKHDWEANTRERLIYNHRLSVKTSIFPKLDADLWLPALLEGVFGSRRWMAARLGARGGKAKSKAKARAARANGKLGGRPRKVRSRRRSAAGQGR
jgi:hypothetical protein